MAPPKKTNPATEKPVSDSPYDHLTPDEKITSLKAENLRLKKLIVQAYGADTSLKNEIKALRDANENLHSQIPSAEQKLKDLAISLTVKYPQLTCPFCHETFVPK